jgi:hypothetical protein
LLAALCRAAGLGADPSDLDDDEERVIQFVAAELSHQAPRGVPDTDGLLAIHALLRAAQQFPRWNPDRAQLQEVLVDAFSSGRVDVTAAVETAFTDLNGGPVVLKDIVQSLVRRGLVDPLHFIDVDNVRACQKHVPGAPQWNQDARERDPRLLDYWAVLDPERAVAACETLVAKEPIATLAVLAIGIERTLDLGQPWRSSHLYPFLGSLARTLCRRRATEAPDDRRLTHACWGLARRLAETAPEILGDDYAVLHELALTDLGQMRSHLRSVEAQVFLESESQRLSDGAFFVLETDPKSLWPVIRRMLLSLRDLPHRGVPLDLRTWDERDLERLPMPWAWVPERIARILEQFLRRELEQDPDLKQFRREFGRFCIDRIKTKERSTKTSFENGDFVEPVPVWRAAYATAVRELHPNLGESGHHALVWSSKNDPDDEVRTASKSSSQIVRHSRGLPSNMSPRRAVFAAMWLLRQAHVCALGETPTETGALRTYRKEMRRQADLEK